MQAAPRHELRATVPTSDERRVEILARRLRGVLGAPRSGYSSCAVVGSSGSLLAERHGAQIDEHEYVIRFNLAPTAGYEAHVGAKTHLRFLNTQAMGEVLGRCDRAGWCALNASCCPQDERVILNSNSASILSCYQSVCGSGVARKSTGLDSSAVVTHARRSSNTMSGTFGIAAALSLCKPSGRPVSVFGFTSAAEGAAAHPYHYYDRCGPDMRADSLSSSASALAALATRWPRVRLVIPSRNPKAPAASHVLSSDAFQTSAVLDAVALPATPTSHVAGDEAHGCPDAREANARLAARLIQTRDAQVPSRLTLSGGLENRLRLPPPMALARRLRVSSSPYVVLHGYVNHSVADAMRAEVVRAIEECSEIGEGHDRRKLGVEASPRYPLTRAFATDSYLLSVARHHLAGRPGTSGGAGINVKAQAGLTLAGENSGGGWHKDTISRGIKALLYLDDVDAGNGPFAMLRDYQEKQLTWSADAVSGVRRRLNESVVRRACEVAGSRARVEELHAPKGSVIVFEISSAHRGMPCRRGERASLTNYYKVAKASTSCRRGSRVADGPFMNARGVHARGHP